MSATAYDRIKEAVNSPGIGAFTLGGAVIGYRAFSSKLAAGDIAEYFAENQTVPGEWEMGVGTYNGSSISRTFVLDSSSGGTVVPFSAGTIHVWSNAPASVIQGVMVSLFGDGSDGNATLTTTSTTAGPLTSGRLTRDAYYKNLAIVAGGRIQTAGQALAVSEVLDLSAAPLQSIQGKGVGGGVGSTTPSTRNANITPYQPTTFGSRTLVAGIAGSTGAGGAGNAQGAGTGYMGGASGVPGKGGNASGGATLGGAAGAFTGLPVFSLSPIFNPNRMNTTLTSPAAAGSSAPSAGAGAGDGVNAGGQSTGAAEGGMAVVIYARFIRRSGAAAAAINSGGGDGTAGGAAAGGNAGGGGGGAGAGGGLVFIVCERFLDASQANVIDVSGGNGAVGGAGTGTGIGGDGGGAGEGGRVIIWELGTGTLRHLQPVAAVAGTAAVGAAGGAGATATVSRFAL